MFSEVPGSYARDKEILQAIIETNRYQKPLESQRFQGFCSVIDHLLQHGEHCGIAIKTGSLTDVSVLLGKSKYADVFSNGTITHTFLDITDYHRYHIPVSGIVREVLLIPQYDAPGGVITWDKQAGRYVEYYSESIGWQSIETRETVIIETETGGYVAVIPVGMCQVSSVNFEDTVIPGARVEKGDPLGYFMFGGDIVMIFSEDLDFDLTAEAGIHFNMGEEYGRIHISR